MLLCKENPIISGVRKDDSNYIHTQGFDGLAGIDKTDNTISFFVKKVNKTVDVLRYTLLDDYDVVLESGVVLDHTTVKNMSLGTFSSMVDSPVFRKGYLDVGLINFSSQAEFFLYLTNCIDKWIKEDTKLLSIAKHNVSILDNALSDLLDRG